MHDLIDGMIDDNYSKNNINIVMANKIIEELSKLEKKFIEGGIKNGYDYKEVKQIFDYIFEFANYGFNHSHSLAYSYISY